MTVYWRSGRSQKNKEYYITKSEGRVKQIITNTKVGTDLKVRSICISGRFLFSASSPV